MVYFTLDDSIYSVHVLFSTEMFKFPTEGLVMVVTNNAYPLFTIYRVFDRHIVSFLCSSVKYLIGVWIFFGLPLGFFLNIYYTIDFYLSILYDSQKTIKFLAT